MAKKAKKAKKKRMVTAPNQRSSSGGRPTGGHQDLALSQLRLDEANPRFGGKSAKHQVELLDLIVETFGIKDVLSSLAVNGYFQAEPVVCRREKSGDSYIVVEGNRRLAACLILAGDPRAKNQDALRTDFQRIWKNHGSPSIDPIPAIVFEPEEQKSQILSFLGVRHIASAQPWDSYAKAAWVARAIKESKLEIEDVAEMIGDHHGTVRRLLEGYFIVQQLQDEGMFDPKHSIRRGRGTITEYPFSWIYTILGHSSAREFLGLKDSRRVRENPIPRDKLGNGKLLMDAMFGNSDLGRPSAITDSRQLRSLSSALEDAEKIQYLGQGKPLDEIEALTQPFLEQVKDGLAQTRQILERILGRWAGEPLNEADSAALEPRARACRSMAVRLHKELREAAYGSDDED